MKRYLTFVLLIALSYAAVAQSSPESTENIMKAAYAKAGAENKSVILIFHASWCGWCHKMEASINDSTCNKFFDKNYVVAYLDVQENGDKKALENPGAEDLMKKYKAESAGLPFWLILDPKGNTLATSAMNANGTSSNSAADNVGCPATEKEVDYLVKVLKSTSTLTDSELAIIKTRFRKNEPVKPTTGTN